MRIKSPPLSRIEFSALRNNFKHSRIHGILINVRRIGILIGISLAAFIARDATAQLPATFASATAAHTHIQLLLSADPAQPGDTIWAGMDLKMDEGWHTYWKNSGAAGLPTKITWHLPPGVTAGEIQWPLPEKIPPVEVTTYGYENEAVLLVLFTLGVADFETRPARFEGGCRVARM